jgi:hypothetical protein
LTLHAIDKSSLQITRQIQAYLCHPHTDAQWLPNQGHHLLPYQAQDQETVTYLLEFDKEIQWWILELMDQRYHRTNFWWTCNHYISISYIMGLWASPTQLIDNIRPTFVLIYHRSMDWGKWHTSSSVYVKFKAGKKLPLCSSQFKRMSFASTALRVLCRGICSELVWESGASEPV